MTPLEKYYGKFKEDHRLTTRHGVVEFTTSMTFIHDCIEDCKNKGVENVKILDVGAGTGRYSVALCREGYDVTAVELVRHNLDILQSKHEMVKSWQGDARNLSFLDDGKFDVTLLFGPMYHLHNTEDKLLALKEARRVTKKGGYILVAYVMNEYAVLTYCFKQNHICECMKNKTLSEDFHTITGEEDLYSYIRLEDIDRLNELSGLKRVKIFAPDGAADYMRRELNAMDEESFQYFMQYHLATCERKELLGASSHTVDILYN